MVRIELGRFPGVTLEEPMFRPDIKCVSSYENAGSDGRMTNIEIKKPCFWVIICQQFNSRVSRLFKIII